MTSAASISRSIHDRLMSTQINDMAYAGSPQNQAIEAALDGKISQVLAESRVLAATKKPFLFTVPISDSMFQYLQSMFPGVQHRHFSFSCPIGADIEVLRQGMTQTLFSTLLCEGLVVHVGGAQYMHAPYGRRVHCESVVNSLSSMKMAQFERTQIESMYKEARALRDIMGADMLPFSTYYGALKDNPSVACHDAMCARPAGHVVFDLIAAPMSQEQAIGAMLQHQCETADAFLLFEEQSFVGGRGAVLSTGVSAVFDADDESIHLDTKFGRTMFPPFRHSWLVQWMTRSFVRAAGRVFFFEIVSQIGPMFRFNITGVKSECIPAGRRAMNVHHRLWKTGRIPLMVVRAPMLISLAGNVHAGSSYRMEQCVVTKELFDKVHLHAVSLDGKKGFSQETIRDKVRQMSERVVVKGTTVEVHAPLDSRTVDIVSKVIFARAFIGRFETSRVVGAGSSLVGELRDVSEKSTARLVTRAAWRVLKSYGDTLAETLSLGMGRICEDIVQASAVESLHTATEVPAFESFDTYAAGVVAAAEDRGFSASVVARRGWPGEWLLDVVRPYSGADQYAETAFRARIYPVEEPPVARGSGPPSYRSRADSVDSGATSTGSTYGLSGDSTPTAQVFSRSATPAGRRASHTPRVSVDRRRSSLGATVPLVMPGGFPNPMEGVTRPVEVEELEFPGPTAEAVEHFGDTAALFLERSERGPDEAPRIAPAVIAKRMPDPEATRYQHVHDPAYGDTINEEYANTFPRVANSNVVEDQALMDAGDYRVGIETHYLSMPVENIGVKPREVYLSKLAGPARPDAQQTSRNLLIGAHNRNMDPAMPKISQPADLIPRMFEEFIDKFCVPDARDRMAQMRERGIDLSLGRTVEWMAKADATKLGRIEKWLEDNPELESELSLHDHKLMLKGKGKPPVDANAGIKYTKFQTIVHHETFLSSLWSSLFMDAAQCLISLARPGVYLGLRGDDADLQEFLTQNYPYNRPDVVHSQTDLSQYDKSAESRAREAKDLFMASVGFTEERVRAWSGGQRVKYARCLQLGFKMVIIDQQSSGVGDTALANLLWNAMMQAYIFPKPIMAAVRGDDGYAVFASSSWSAKAVGTAYAEVCSQTAKLIEQVNAFRIPYFCSKFLVIDDEHLRVHLLPDPIKAVESLSRPLPKDEAKFAERYESWLDRMKQWSVAYPRDDFNRMCREWFLTDTLDASRLVDALISAGKSREVFRTLWEDTTTTILQ